MVFQRNADGSCSRLASTGRLVGLALIAFGLSGCAALRVGSDFERSTNFTSYHAFSFLPQERHGSRNPLVVQRAHDAIQEVLAGKGFVYMTDPAAADFVVEFTIGSAERTDVNSYAVPYVGWYGGYVGWWGYRYWGTGLDVRQYREGTLAIDVFDAHSHKPVWHGWAKKELTASDLEHSAAPIRVAVEHVLGRFPPKE